MRRHTEIRVAAALAVLFTPGGASALDNATRPPGYAPREARGDAVSVAGLVTPFVIVKDVDPWGQSWNEMALGQEGYPYSVVHSGKLAQQDWVGNRTKVVVVASDQPDEFYARLADRRAQVNEFLNGGGVLVAHAFCRGWYGGSWQNTPWIPGISGYSWGPLERTTWVPPQHTILRGIEDHQLDYWFYTALDYFAPEQRPKGARIVVKLEHPEERPCYIEYRRLNGVVLATTMALDWWGGANASARFQMLRQELRYALSMHKVKEIAWAGEDDLQRDGVRPDAGPKGTQFMFKVKLTHPEAKEPDSVRLILSRDGAIHGRYDMAAAPGGTGSRRIYRKALLLGFGNYSYKFAATFPGEDPAQGEPTAWRRGPIVQGSPPYLAWSRAAGFKTDGVHPNGGRPRDEYEFRVVYRSHQGIEPGRVKVKVWRNGSLFVTQPLKRQGGSAASPQSGIPYQAIVQAGAAGTYEYLFVGTDRRGRRGVGPAAQRMRGPRVTTGATTAVAGLSAVPTKAGVQVTLSLSAGAQVSARIMNVAGRPVRTLCRAKDCEAGTNTLLWNACGDNGLAVPNGTYLVEVTAKAGDGAQTRALAQVQLRR